MKPETKILCILYVFTTTIIMFVYISCLCFFSFGCSSTMMKPEVTENCFDNESCTRACHNGDKEACRKKDGF